MTELEPGNCDECDKELTTQSYDVVLRRPNYPLGDRTARLCSLKCLRRWAK